MSNSVCVTTSDQTIDEMPNWKRVWKTCAKTLVHTYSPRSRSMLKHQTYLMHPLIAILSQTFHDYTNNNELSHRGFVRQLNGFALCAIAWLTVIKFYLASLIDNPRLWPYIGDPFYLTGDRKLFNLVIGSIALNAALMRTLFLSAQMLRCLPFIDHFSKIMTGEGHHLTKANFNKLKTRCSFSEVFMLKQIPINALVTFSLIYGYYTVYAYLRQDYKYTLFWSLVWWLLTTLAAWVAASMQGIAYSIIYLCQYFLKLRFRQIAERLHHLFCRKNSNELKKLLSEHNLMVKKTEHYNQFLRTIIAINYFAATLAIDLLSYIAFFGQSAALFRVGNGVIAANKIGVIMLATYSSAQLSNQVHSLYGPLNSVFIASSMHIRTKFKITNAIERLAGPVIGFYCYDLFAFNMNQFVKYFFSCIGVFLLMVQTIETFRIF